MAPRKKKESSDVQEMILPPLTSNQTNCLVFIAKFFEKFRYYPTRKEISDEMDGHPSSVWQMVLALEKKGYLKRISGENRNIRITKVGKMKLEMIEKEEEAGRE